MKYKRNTAILACCLVIMTGFLISGIYSVSKKDAFLPDQQTEQLVARQEDTANIETVSNLQNAQEMKYFLRLYQGKIAVFDAQNTEKPLEVTDISADTLRIYDKQELTKGIYIAGDTELSMILEDFGS